MKNLKYLVIILIFIIAGCTKNDNVDDSFEVGILPLNATSNDEIKIVHTICSYETLKKLEINNYSIIYQREFNSLMKQVCTLKSDTLLIGKLQAGTYTYKYELIDISGNTLSGNPVTKEKTGTFEIK